MVTHFCQVADYKPFARHDKLFCSTALALSTEHQSETVTSAPHDLRHARRNLRAMPRWTYGRITLSAVFTLGRLRI